MTKRDGTTWWIHGSAPDGAPFFDVALDAADVSVTTNAGVLAWLGHRRRSIAPTYYWLQDPTAIELFGWFARVAQLMGTVILTDVKTDLPVTLNCVTAGVVEPIVLVAPLSDPPTFAPGVWQHVTLSGLLCLQYVANRALVQPPVERIILTGMTGYASSPAGIEVDTFDGRLGKRKGARHNEHRIAPFLHSVIEALPDVQFMFCGKPHRVLGPDDTAICRHPNLTICRTPDGLAAALEPRTIAL